MKEEIRNELMEMGSHLGGNKIPTPYTIPEGYFEKNTSSLAAITGSNDGSMLKHAADMPLPYEIPPVYFEEFADKLQPALLPAKEKGLLISFNTRRWAAAAVLLILAGTGMFTFLRSPVSGNEKAMLAGVADNEIKDYFVYAGLPVPEKSSATDYLADIQIDRKDIISYLDETGWDID